MRRFIRFIACCVLSVSLAATPAFADATVTPALADVAHHPNGGREGMVVAGEKTAAQIGADMLAQGGNAVDAAVATAFALAVTYPRAGNIGGGGFMLVYMQDEGKTIAIDYREMAPAAATQDMYLDDEGNVDIDAIRHSHKSSGVPGTVAGLLHAHEKYGVLSRKKVMAPAIRLAEKGYTLSYFNAAMFEEERDALTRNAAARAEFFKPDGSGYLPGDVMRRKGLAKTLKAISKLGREGFYSGWVADAIADDMAANGGFITRDDLARYKVIEREPVIGTYRGYEIHSMPPPSSGGIHLIQMLNMLETRPPYSSAGDSADALHFLAETMRLAFADRAELLGDTDFVDVPVQGLMSKDYAKSLAATINPNKAGDSSKIGAGDPTAYESHDTTQFSVIDKAGNFVSNTYTLNMSFGSGVVVPGTGILLNNQMDDFAAAPGVPNYYGLVGNDKNAIAASKRPLSSMTPTLIFKDGAPFMAIGGAGGSRIITSVLQVIINVIDRGMNIADAMEHPRIHHQWLPDQILYEPGISDDTKALLAAKGHKLTSIDWYARPQTVLYKDGWSYGYSDTRMPGGGACSPDGGC
jgi:gamma-glutamyltranspeptidase / glutathione hydrolase